ncbi:6690_t:CDS:2 [Paraglomus brasilianum]|uniref:6690_t:CDS:1 n=1 Tax=Paraglomus brasilianum TaxID=144538 RepID=A0A9N9BIM3_9GLOM|nr:6690_t:CDS:2 [Paraglomus brasilianum]
MSQKYASFNIQGPSIVVGVIVGAALAVCGLKLFDFWSTRPEKKRREQGKGIVHGIEGLVGNTPLIRLKSLSEATGCEILLQNYRELAGKSRSGSPKDRAALNMIRQAESQGLIYPNTGSTIFEGTSGSTGISIAMIARAKGYNAWIVMPDDQAKEKYQLLEKLGATVEKVRPASIVDKNQFVNLAKQRALEFGTGNRDDERASEAEDYGKRPRGFFTDQFENLDNYKAHYNGTAPEIYEQTNGKIDAIVTGTGGTIAGLSRYLKPLIPNLKVFLVDPPGSGLFHKIKHNIMYSPYEAEGTRRRHQVDTIVEGVGLNRITANFEIAHGWIDDAIFVSDEEAVAMARYLVREEGEVVPGDRG